METISDLTAGTGLSTYRCSKSMGSNAIYCEYERPQISEPRAGMLSGLTPMITLLVSFH